MRTLHTNSHGAHALLYYMQLPHTYTCTRPLENLKDKLSITNKLLRQLQNANALTNPR